MINTRLLKAKIVEAGLSQREIVRIMKREYPESSITLNSLNRKINNTRDFKISEANLVCKICGIKDPAFYEASFFK